MGGRGQLLEDEGRTPGTGVGRGDTRGAEGVGRWIGAKGMRHDEARREDRRGCHEL